MTQRPDETKTQYLFRVENELRDRLAAMEIRENLKRADGPIWPYVLGISMVAIFVAVALYFYITKGA